MGFVELPVLDPNQVIILVDETDELYEQHGASSKVWRTLYSTSLPHHVSHLLALDTLNGDRSTPCRIAGGSSATGVG